MQVVVFGSGQMGSAIINALKDSFEVIAVVRSLKTAKQIQGVKYEIFSKDYNIDNKNIILAFKPYAIDEVSTILKGKSNLCISVLAKTPLELLKTKIQSKYYTLAMPNIASFYKASITPFFKSDENESLSEDILSQLGNIVKCSSQSELKAATAISGCSPAFLALIAESIETSGVYIGLNRELSNKLTCGLFKSVSAMLENGIDSTNIQRSVCSPGGITIKGIYELEKNGVRGTIFDAIIASSK